MYSEQASEEFSCNATNGVLVAPLQHGASYHVVLLATNGAGMSTRVVSRSFVVDLFSNIEVCSPLRLPTLLRTRLPVYSPAS